MFEWLPKSRPIRDLSDPYKCTLAKITPCRSPCSSNFSADPMNAKPLEKLEPPAGIEPPTC